MYFLKTRCLVCGGDRRPDSKTVFGGQYSIRLSYGRFAKEDGSSICDWLRAPVDVRLFGEDWRGGRQ